MRPTGCGEFRGLRSARSRHEGLLPRRGHRAANDSDDGLGATVCTTDAAEMREATNRIVSGVVWINAPILDNDVGPFGGREMSGLGRRLGAEGLGTFRRTKL
ncbi:MULTISPECIES: aldehyde dehydrogenase family protein [Streptomyces]|uniref:aldehyde dehydrogenase family protein n=1 Tax=Streptomyces TaxID=1883 RepID=UPI0029AF1338|nr:aldehyde dehydrogenase family protein [Streptomyces scabiei]MDX3119220.1 aldehyde dehydrogenase family protein [Streptomyces scabiei]